jgi:hypothetical protein
MMDSSSITPFRLNVDNIRKLDVKLTPIELPPELRASLIALRGEPEAPAPATRPDPVYATVKVGGEVVATLYESGQAVTSNAAYGRVRNLPSMGEGETLTGPALAQKRADEIAATLGGRVERASSVPDGSPSQTDAARSAGARTLLQAQMLALWTRV